jgi:CheY-like chemotaxis protein
MPKDLKILLVEDEVVTAMLVTMQLKRNGYEIMEHVVTGEEAIVSAKTYSPDVILMDIRLAGEMDGIDASKVIIAERPVAIIFLTSYDDQVTKLRADRLNPLGYLVKPLDISAFCNLVESHKF